VLKTNPADSSKQLRGVVWTVVALARRTTGGGLERQERV
jgi:hypothetical protein